MDAMGYEVRVEEVTPRQIAALRGVARRAELGATIISMLDKIWPVVREQEVHTGHNVVVYFDGVMHIEAGVEVFSPLHEVNGISLSQTPAGTAATTAHFGDYAELGHAYDALNRWCTENGYQSAGPSWEVYGDWHEDPRQVRTDIYQLVAPKP